MLFAADAYTPAWNDDCTISAQNCARSFLNALYSERLTTNGSRYILVCMYI